MFEVQMQIGGEWRPVKRYYHERAAKWQVTHLKKVGENARYIRIS